MRRVVRDLAGSLLAIGAFLLFGVMLPLQAAEPAKENAAPLHVTYYFLPG